MMEEIYFEPILDVKFCIEIRKILDYLAFLLILTDKNYERIPFFNAMQISRKVKHVHIGISAKVLTSFVGPSHI